ncbi:MAG: hypothetical protein J6S67_03695 [Methanobrevibacter sp.]|nr:hypothetical protein [Methanobrevibacter sp.]
MRRMYSEQELSVIVYQVMGQYIEDGAFDQTIADYIDAYLVEHPIDPTAITGLDIAPKDVTASGNITAPSIIENMSGYSFTKSSSQGQYFTLTYVGVVKNGNKITFVIAGSMNFPDVTQIYGIGNFTIPEEIGQKLYPITGTQIAFLSINAHINYATKVNVSGIFNKNSNTDFDVRVYSSGLTANTDYSFRIEQTFLLSDSLVSE